MRANPKAFRAWEAAEDELLIRNYKPDAQLRVIVPGRTANAIRKRAGRLKLDTGYRFWTTPEVSLLRRMRSDHTYAEITAALHGRTQCAVENQCRRMNLYRARCLPENTGDQILDSIRNRAYLLRYTMSELDILAKCEPYFRKDCLHRGRNYSALMKAMISLGGEISWVD